MVETLEKIYQGVKHASHEAPPEIRACGFGRYLTRANYNIVLAGELEEPMYLIGGRREVNVAHIPIASTRRQHTGPHGETFAALSQVERPHAGINPRSKINHLRSLIVRAVIHEEDLAFVRRQLRDQRLETPLDPALLVVDRDNDR